MLAAMRWLMKQFNYNERRRNIDLQILWPTCRDMASDMDQAKAAFALHCYNDSAWKALGEDEIYRRIEALT